MLDEKSHKSFFAAHQSELGYEWSSARLQVSQDANTRHIVNQEDRIILLVRTGLTYIKGQHYGLQQLLPHMLRTCQSSSFRIVFQ